MNKILNPREDVNGSKRVYTGSRDGLIHKSFFTKVKDFILKKLGMRF